MQLFGRNMPVSGREKQFHQSHALPGGAQPCGTHPALQRGNIQFGGRSGQGSLSCCFTWFGLATRKPVIHIYSGRFNRSIAVAEQKVTPATASDNPSRLFPTRNKL